MSKLIVNVETGETTERELNKTEKDQQKIDETIAAENQVIAEEIKAKRQTILDKLGLTAEEAQLLLQ